MATEDIAVTKFREYLRVKTEQPNPDYEACRSFLFNLADELNIEKKSAFVVAEAPFVIMTIPGSKPELPSVMLYSHTDVVPTFPEHWKYDPYSAYKDEKGDIYARGSQDMKCVGSQYFEAIRRHFNNGKKQWLRTIHIVWGPDEEIGGVNGMKTFCSSDDFKKLNVGFTLDEGIATEDDVYKVFYAERSPWWLKVTFGGSPGHGSKFIENTAMEKLHKFMNNAMSYRAEQMEVLKNNPDWTVGDVTSLNLTIVNGGVQVNVVPDKFIAYCDIRVTPREDCSKLKARIEKWGTDAGDDVTLEFIQSATPSDKPDPLTIDFDEQKNTTPHTNEDPFWAAFEKSLNAEGCKFKREIFIGATDSRFIRAMGIRSIGFSPMINTPSLLHDHNEYLNENVFLRGVEIYQTLIDNIANVPDF